MAAGAHVPPVAWIPPTSGSSHLLVARAPLPPPLPIPVAALPPSDEDGEDEPGQAEQGSDNDDDGLPPLQPNTNRRVVYHEVSEDDDESD